jgi:lysophospholipase L1-like esterase
MHRFLWLALAVAALLVLPAASPAASYLVAVGDSYPAGFQPNARGAGKGGTVERTAFPTLVGESLRKQDRDLRVRNFACPGENTATFLGRSRCGGGSQIRKAESFLREHRGEVRYLLVTIGGNDFTGCINVPPDQLFPCIGRGTTQLDKNAPVIARRLRSAAGSRVRIVATTYFNPLLQRFLVGDPALANAANTVLKNNLNKEIKVAWRPRRGRIADLFAAFDGDDMTPVQFQGQTMPRALQRVCTWSWMCAPAPNGPDIHPNNAGHREIAKVVLRAIR